MLPNTTQMDRRGRKAFASFITENRRTKGLLQSPVVPTSFKTNLSEAQRQLIIS